MPIFASKVSPALFSMVLVCMASQAVAQTYHFTELTLQSGDFSSAVSINNSGQIVGNANASSGGDAVATEWSQSIGRALSTPVPFQAVAINDRGQIAGNVGGMLGPRGPIDSTARAALFDRRGLTVFNGLQPQAPGSQALGINNFGKVVGYAQTTTPYESDSSSLTTHATIFSADAASLDLGTLGGTNSFGYAINSSSNVVGLATSSGDYGTSPTVWKWGQASAIMGSYPWSANDINDQGQIVGSSYRDLTAPGSEPALVQTATLFQPNGDAVFLDNSLNIFGSSVAKATNASGMTVGYSIENINLRGPSHGMLWADGAAFDLNSFLDSSLIAAGWYIKDANDINDAGWIVGDLQNSLTGAQHGYLLSVDAVPEPSTWALLMAGGLFVGWRARRQPVSDRA